MKKIIILSVLALILLSGCLDTDELCGRIGWNNTTKSECLECVEACEKIPNAENIAFYPNQSWTGFNGRTHCDCYWNGGKREVIW